MKSLPLFFQLLIFLWSLSLKAEDSVAIPIAAVNSQCGKEIFFGHNLTHTGEVLCKGHVSAGLQALAGGVTDNFMIGTSPWLISDYQMANIYGRYKSSDKRAFELSYYKACFDSDRCISFDDYQWKYIVDSKYSMEAVWLIMIDRYQLSDVYTIDVNYGAQYYINQAMPFSLKRPTAKVKPWQFHITTLHQINLWGPFYQVGEVGFLIPTDTEAYFHFGSSMGVRFNGFSSHIGFSFTSKARSLFATNREDYQGKRRNSREPYGNDDEFSSYNYELDYSIHPEFALQYQF